jgi:hypothetical protein
MLVESAIVDTNMSFENSTQDKVGGKIRGTIDGRHSATRLDIDSWLYAPENETGRWLRHRRGLLATPLLTRIPVLVLTR